MMRTYESYKDSGIEWIGEIPKHWELKRLKHIRSKDKFSLVDGPFGSNLKSEHYIEDGDVYVIESGFITSGKFRYVRQFKTISLDHFETIKRSQSFEGCIIMSKIGEYYGMSGVLPKLDKPTVISGNCISIKLDNDINKFYIHHTLIQHWNNGTFKKEVQQTGQPFISMTMVDNISFPLPPISEQEQIVSYLDEKTSLIDEMVEKKKRKIELLKEYRTSLINTVVTKGLNPDVPMKDSGIEWIGEIPRHWGFSRIKRLTSVKRGSSPRPIDDPKYFDDNGRFSWVRISDVTKSERYLGETEEKLSDLGSSLSSKIYPNQLFLSIAGSVGKPIISKIDCCIHDGFVWFDGLKYNSELLWYMFTVGSCFKGLGKMGTQLNLNSDTVGMINIPLPPLTEQEQIVTYLDEKTSEIDKTIELENKKIELLKGYRQSLISNVVTGKIKVVSE